MATTVAIVDDDRLVCEHLQDRLDKSGDLTCVGTAYTAAEARDLVRDKCPEIIVLDIMLPRGTNPIDLAAELVRLSPRSKIVVLTAWSDDPRLDHQSEFREKVRASRSGVISWISKSRGINEVMTELRDAVRWRAEPSGPSPLEHALGTYLRTVGSAYAEDPFRVGDSEAKLTPMEARIAAIVAHGLEANLKIDQIARDAHLVPATIRAHIKSIYTKLGVSNQAAFVAEVRRRGLLGD